MRDDVRRDMDKSARVFMSVVVPHLLPVIGGGKIIQVESSACDDVRGVLDKSASIDAFHHIDDSGVRPIASRVQYNCHYGSFTVRLTRHTGATTEMEKISRAISNGTMRPHMHVHSYVRGETELIEGACVETDVLWRFMNTHPECVHTRRNRYDDNEFHFVWWRDMQCHGYEIMRFPMLVSGWQPRDSSGTEGADISVQMTFGEW